MRATTTTEEFSVVQKEGCRTVSRSMRFCNCCGGRQRQQIPAFREYRILSGKGRISIKAAFKKAAGVSPSGRSGSYGNTSGSGCLLWLRRLLEPPQMVCSRTLCNMLWNGRLSIPSNGAPRDIEAQNKEVSGTGEQKALRQKHSGHPETAFLRRGASPRKRLLNSTPMRIW